MALPHELLKAIEDEASRIPLRALMEASRRLTAHYRDYGEDSAAHGNAGEESDTDPGERPAKTKRRREAVGNGGSGNRGVGFDEEVRRVAYSVARLPATFAAVTAALTETAMSLDGLSPDSVLDLGSGPGTAAWAACEVFPSIRQVTCVEHDPGWIEMGRRFSARSDHPALISARWVSSDLARDADGGLRVPRHDLVVLSYSLGEIAADRRTEIVERAWRCTRNVLVIIEPGTPMGFGYVLGARSRGIASGGRVAAPCPHNNVCPMAGTRNWCHFAERLERTRRHRLAKEGALGFEDEKFSYVAVARKNGTEGVSGKKSKIEAVSGLRRESNRTDPSNPTNRSDRSNPPESSAPSSAGRVIDRPSVSKGGVVLPLCTNGGLERREIPRRDKLHYKQAKKAKWGEWWE